MGTPGFGVAVNARHRQLAERDGEQKNMPFFLRRAFDAYGNHHPSSPREIWRIEKEDAVRLDVADPENGIGTFFKARSGEEIWAALRRHAPDWFTPDGTNPFTQTELNPGEYYPRIARPTSRHPTAPGWCPAAGPRGESVTIARSQLASLTRHLVRICETVHPANETFETFGNDIRNLLILACTEVENHWRSVLAANGCTSAKSNTTQYVKLAPAMRLKDFGVTFPAFPWIDYFNPFEGWDNEKPTQSLPWYDAYNAVKHDRERNFRRATLRYVFHAVAAVAVMLEAQFGSAAKLDSTMELAGAIHISIRPIWLDSELYLPPVRTSTGGFSEVYYNF